MSTETGTLHIFTAWSDRTEDSSIVLTYPDDDGRAPRMIGAHAMDGAAVTVTGDARDEGEAVEAGTLFRVRDGLGRTWCAWTDELEPVA